MKDETLELMYSIPAKASIYIKQNPTANPSNIAITLSTKNVTKIRDYIYNNIFNEPIPEKISSISCFCYLVFPSDFIKDDVILIGELSKIE
jgi:hypothetical protein